MPVVNYRTGSKSRDNPYAAPGNVSALDTPDYGQGPTEEFTTPEPGYAVNNPLGWSPELEISADGTPDSERLGKRPILGFRGAPQFLNRFYRRMDSDRAQRNSVQQIDADGYEEKKGLTAGQGRFAPNPNSVPWPETRPTQSLAPRSYLFWRPFGPGAGGIPKASARTFNGEHFSMADHRRTYEIYGMQPRHSWRNTYRLTPEPWDEDIIDMPTDEDASVNAIYVQPVATEQRSRSYRLR